MVFLGIILFSMASVSLSKYTCRQYNPGHITCLARNPTCQITDDHTLSFAERHEILAAHNQIRREAAKGLLRRFGLPEAANMKKMEYDDDLANNAQAHVEVFCQLHHDRPSQRTTGSYPDVGQNVYITEVKYQTLQEDTWTKVIETLWGKNEAAMLRGGHFGQGMTLRGYNLHDTGHLTQLLWAQTERVGCGKIIFENNGGTSDLRTCDYGEGGNVIGSEMYIKGPACSACPASHPYCDDGLCSRIPAATYGFPRPSFQNPPAPNYYTSVTPTAYSYSSNSHSYYQPPSPPVNRTPAQYTWWGAPAQRNASPQISYYNTIHMNAGGAAPLQDAFHQRTYNYQRYTVLRRKRRALKTPMRASRVL